MPFVWMSSFCTSLGELQAGDEHQKLEHGCKLQGCECSWGCRRCKASCSAGRAMCLRAAPEGLHTAGTSSSWDRSSHQREVSNGVGPPVLFIFVQVLHNSGHCGILTALWAQGQTRTSCQFNTADIIYLMLKQDITWAIIIHMES